AHRDLHSFPTRRSSDLAALDQIGSLGRGKPGSLVDFVERSTLITYASSARLEGIMRGQTASADYPGFSLAQHLKLIAQLIKAGRSEEHTSELQSPCNLV